MTAYVIVCLLTLYTAGSYRSSILITLFLTEIVIFAAMLALAVIINRHTIVKIDKNTVYGYMGGSVRPSLKITNNLPIATGRISYKLLCGGGKPVKVNETLLARSGIASAAGIMCGHCGIIGMEYRKITVSDYLGIFRLKHKIADSTVTAVVLPPVKSLKINISAYADGIGSLPNGGGIQDAIQLKKYEYGDTIKGIHWNIYARTDELYTRHTGDDDRYIPLFGIDTAGINSADADKRDAFYTICCALVRGFCEQYGSVKISSPYNTEINDENGIRELVYAMYRSTYGSSTDADFVLKSDLTLKFGSAEYKFDAESYMNEVNKGEITIALNHAMMST